VLYPLAGQEGVSERTHSSAGGFELTPESAVQVAAFVRGSHAKPLDRGNVLNVLNFGTSRLFSTPAEAQLWCLDYKTAFPAAGTLFLDAVAADGTFTRRCMANAVADPPRRRCNGATVLLDYLVRGGAIGTPATALINPTGDNNSIYYTAVASGSGGNGITIEYVISGSGSTVASVVVTTLAIVVTAGSATTAASVIAAVNATALAAALVHATARGAVTGVIAAVGATNLSGGA
jgi:hypothetical protein